MNYRKIAELIQENREAIADKMREAYSMVIYSDGLMQSTIYISDSGEVCCHEQTQGGNWGHNSPKLHPIATISEPGYNRDDYRDDPNATDDDVDSWIISEFDPDVLIDGAIKNALMWAEYSNED